MAKWAAFLFWPKQECGGSVVQYTGRNPNKLLRVCLAAANFICYMIIVSVETMRIFSGEFAIFLKSDSQERLRG